MGNTIPSSTPPMRTTGRNSSLEKIGKRILGAIGGAAVDMTGYGGMTIKYLPEEIPIIYRGLHQDTKMSGSTKILYGLAFPAMRIACACYVPFAAAIYGAARGWMNAPRVGVKQAIKNEMAKMEETDEKGEASLKDVRLRLDQHLPVNAAEIKCAVPDFFKKSIFSD